MSASHDCELGVVLLALLSDVCPDRLDLPLPLQLEIGSFLVL
jgi:hypothetical protein